MYALVGVFVFLTLRENFQQVKHYHILRPALLVAAAVAFAAQFAVNSVVWAKLMEYTGAKISLCDSVYVYVSSFIVRYIPGNVWAIAARATYNKSFGVKVLVSIWGWVIENISFLLVGLVFSLFTLFYVAGIPQGVVWIVAVAIPVSTVFLFRYELLERLVRILVKKRFPEVVAQECGEFSLSLDKRAVLLIMYVVAWLFFSVQFVLVAAAMTAISIGDVVQLAGINALAWSIGYISLVTPSGTGVREGIMMISLTALGIAGDIDAIAIALAARLTSIIGEVAYFGVVRLIYAITEKT